MPSTAGGPVVQEDGGVTFTLADPHGRLSAVRLVHELARALPLDFARERGRWWLRIPPPPVDRMEYLFEIEDHNGDRATITDPANPARVPGAFGDKSELHLAGYREPAWLGRPAVAATVTPFVVPAPLLDDDVTGELWSPPA